MFDKLQQANRLNDNGSWPYLRSHPLTTQRMADMQSRLPGGRCSQCAAHLEHAHGGRACPRAVEPRHRCAAPVDGRAPGQWLCQNCLHPAGQRPCMHRGAGSQPAARFSAARKLLPRSCSKPCGAMPWRSARRSCWLPRWNWPGGARSGPAHLLPQAQAGPSWCCARRPCCRRWRRSPAAVTAQGPADLGGLAPARCRCLAAAGKRVAGPGAATAGRARRGRSPCRPLRLRGSGRPFQGRAGPGAPQQHGRRPCGGLHHRHAAACRGVTSSRTGRRALTR
jgi:hypothetical protein